MYSEVELSKNLDEYIASMTAKEVAALKVAAESLGSSFDLAKSNGFLKFIKTKPTPRAEP